MLMVIWAVLIGCSTSSVLSLSGSGSKVVTSVMLYTAWESNDLGLSVVFVSVVEFKWEAMLYMLAQARMWGIVTFGCFSVLPRNSICFTAITPNLPTRLETRTKESNICASLWVASPWA